MVVVMPEMHNNFYTDQAIGWPYLKYVAEELPRIIETYLRVSPKRENTYVAGLSMGGYGAMKIALTYPEKFGFAASFSGALDIVALMQDDKEQIAHEGQNLRGKKSDTEVVLKKEFIFGLAR
ncbi:MAG: alpha/beta hydrolase [Christensenellales bacterium]